MKNIILLFLLFSLLFSLGACKESPYSDTTLSSPQTNAALFDFVMQKWENGQFADLYEYAGSEIIALMDKTNFSYMFSDISSIGGTMNAIKDKKSTTKDGVDMVTAVLDFDTITVNVTLSFKDTKIVGFFSNLQNKTSFEIEKENNVVERHFILESDGYALNAVYTYIKDDKKHPVVLLIAGSGPSDYNETIGIMKPFADLADEFAKAGINSLRMDKRTLNYAEKFAKTDGIEQEYIIDCKAALAYIKAQENIGKLYLLGHSLGGQIAPYLATMNKDIDGMILLNSSPRNLALISCDQYVATDSANKVSYEKYRDEAIAATPENATGKYYFGASDYYWASLNPINTIENIKKASIPTLIINSTEDRQIFDTDLALWQDNLSETPNIKIMVGNKMSHFIYAMDVSNPAALYFRQKLPVEIISELTAFIEP